MLRLHARAAELGLCMFNMSFRLPTQLWMWIRVWIGCLPSCLPAWLGWVAVYNPVACLLSVRLAGVPESADSVIVHSDPWHAPVPYNLLYFFFLYFPAIFYFFFLLCSFLSFFVGRTQPQHINFRTDIGQPFLQPVDAVRSVRHCQHGRVHFLHALLWSACPAPLPASHPSRQRRQWCRLIEIGAWTS